MKRLIHVQSWEKVCWNKASHGTIKVNTNGSFSHNLLKTGIGRIVRDSLGDLIMAFSIYVQCSSSKMVEGIAIEFGVKWYFLNGHTNFTLELDFMLVANMVTKEDTLNFKLQ